MAATVVIFMVLLIKMSPFFLNSLKALKPMKTPQQRIRIHEDIIKKFSRRQLNIHSENGPGSDLEKTQSRPPIIPFDDNKGQLKPKSMLPDVIDFARKDLPLKPIQELQEQLSKKLASFTGEGKNDEIKQLQQKGVKQEEDITERKKRISALSNTERDSDGNINTDPDLMRPTGYDAYDPDDEPNYPPSFIDDSTESPKNPLTQIFEEIYVGSPYDSRNKKQARFVVRSITALSFIIGLVFTFIWYAFPGKFISYRENKDFTERYPKVYMDPDNLLKNSRNSMTLLEDPAEQTFDNNDDIQNKKSSTTNPNPDDLIINREVQRFPSPDNSDSFFAKPTIEL